MTHFFETVPDRAGGTIPVQPQPSIFETTVVIVGDDAIGEDRLVDHIEVLAIMGRAR